MSTAQVEWCAPQLSRKRWTREECDDLSESLDRHLELIEGKLVDKMGKKRPHVTSLVLVQIWLQQVFGARRVNPEPSIDVAPADNPTSEPEPDLIVTREDVGYYLYKGNPRPQDLLLVVEIADSSLYTDLTVKAQLYARAGIADYWVLDVAHRCMIVHRDPYRGRYRSVSSYGPQDCIAPLAAPSSFLRIADAFAGESR